MNYHIPITCILVLLLAPGCRAPSGLLETGELEKADIAVNEFINLIPDYSGRLHTLSGDGRALISQPGASDRITVNFHSDRQASLITFRNRVGIEGGHILVENDSVLIYNRIEKTAEKVSLHDANLTQAGALATINLIDLFHHPLTEPDVNGIWQDEHYYVASLQEGATITVDRQSGLLLDVQPQAGAPYSRINYEAYETLDGFQLPRRITIFSSDGETRLTLLIRRLQVNRPIPELEIDIPEEIPIQIP